MELPSETVLVFDQTEDLCVFTSFVQAANWMEAIDVAEGEYTAAYTPDGGVVALTAPESWRGPVLLARTGRTDLADLDRRVARYWQLHQVGHPSRDTAQTARFLIDRENRSPKGRKRFTDAVSRMFRTGEKDNVTG
ncbi:hypothetical protein ACFY5C_05175 [Streptomyces sp. NPDC012935]|uniref:hypothetical protein n=1 Tax=Streptomyces sp. NPDC012935 TaxID=3364857 RepID=UPI0036CA0449